MRFHDEKKPYQKGAQREDGIAMIHRMFAKMGEAGPILYLISYMKSFLLDPVLENFLIMKLNRNYLFI